MNNTKSIDPYSKPVFGLANKAARSLWWLCYTVFFRISPKPMFAWRRLILRVFGAHLGKGVAIHPGARIWAPWNLHCRDMVAVANGAEIYNPAVVFLGSHAIISQDAYLCGASHDYNDPDFPFFSKPITVGDYAWVCARACVMPGVTIHDGAVLGLGSVATRDLEPWFVYAGSPAKPVRKRTRTVDLINP